MLALREAEHANLELPEAKRRSRAAFGRSRALESTATGTMLSVRRSRFFASGSRTVWPLEPRFGEHRHRHNAQCAKKPVLRFREPDSVATGETRRAKPHINCILCEDLKLIKEPRFGEHRHRHNAQCAKKPVLRFREPDSVATGETRRAKPHINCILCEDLKLIKALREEEHTNLKLPEAKRRSRATFGRNRVLESTATGTMLSVRRSRFFASGSRTVWPLVRREERSRT
ncbi:unnamed protein product [Coccothraustes coccothraustes]